MPTVLRALALALLALLLVPLTLVSAPPASAADLTFTVNSAGDAPDAVDDGVCETAVGNATCTLRAALEEAAAGGGAVARVGIALPADTTITLGSHVSLPANTTVDGCDWADDLSKPCVTLAGTSLGAPVRLTGAGATLRNVAVVGTEESGGILVTGSDAVVSQVWVGMDTLGVATPLPIGVLVRASQVVIGDQGADFRTTIVNAEVGIEIDGVDNVAVNATNIGLNADGMPAAQNGHAVAGGLVGVRITSGDADVPDGINIGNAVSPSAHATPACDDACNAIGQMSVAAIKVDLPGTEAPAVYVRGNHLGLAADGTTPAAKPGAVGVEAGRSSMVVGGVTAASGNVIAGGAYGVRHLGPVGNVNLAHSLVGTDATGTAALPPSEAGVLAEGTYSGVSNSRIVVAPGATGAVLTGDNALADGNVFGLLAGGAPAPMVHAIRIVGDDGLVGGELPAEGNVICSASGAAVVIAGGDQNDVRGNRIGVDEAGAPCAGARANRSGVVVKHLGADQAERNAIGGPVGDENVISHSLHNAITLASLGGNNAVHNVGTGNQGLMLDIGGQAIGEPDDGDGVGNPHDENAGIPVPQITSATSTLVSGVGGSAGDYIYVYATDSAAGAAPHGLTALLGEDQVSADGQGWSFVPSAPLSPGTRITAIAQARPENYVSEFATVVTVGATPGVPGTSGALTVAGTPLIKGRAMVGRKVRVVVPASAPAGAVVTVQWLVGKRAVAGATKPVLRLRAGHLGKKVSARVTWTLPGSPPVVLATARVRVRR